MSHSPMTVAAAKELCRRVANECNVNADDQWLVESEVFLTDAEAMLKAAGVPELVAALEGMRGGWRYIRSMHGDLYGVGWDRCEESSTSALAFATGELS